MPDLFLGLDIGTSGARAILIDREGAVRAEGKAAMAEFGENHRSPAAWWGAASEATRTALAQAEPAAVRAIAVDGTSGTMVGLDSEGAPIGNGIMYNDPCQDAGLLARIADAAPGDSAALGASSALARAIALTARQPAKILHQADWIASQFSGRFASDENNALKTGFDLNARRWPDWIGEVGFDTGWLPDVAEPGTAIGPVSEAALHDFGLAPDTLVVAGTTDGCASFVATGAEQPGDGVTALGTTMTIKLLSDKQISAPHYGIYSHRILGQWLAGGASNTGGKVLLKYFTPEALSALSGRIDPGSPSPLDYYPLTEPGERFPISDPALAPRLAPRPEDDAAFLKGMLDGIARVEALAYARLEELGAPALRCLRTVGGGAQNDVWSELRQNRLGVPTVAPASTEAAYGAALLARKGAM